MRRIRSAVCFALGALFVAIVSGCAKRETASAARPPSAAAAAPTLRLSQRNEPADLDPALATLPDEFAILRALSEGLLLPGENGGAPQPGAAARHDISSDGLTYTFHLRENLRWSDGEPVTAADFVASYQRALTPATASPRASVFFPVKNARAFLRGEIADFSAVGFHAADARTLVVTLAEPTPRFPAYVASGPWIPVNPRVVARHGRAWTRPENFVGNGPFTLVEWQPHQRIVVRKNPLWRDAAHVRLAEIQFIHFDNGEAEERAFRAGQIDATMSVPFSKVEVYARENPAVLHRAPLIETRYLSFNCERAPLADPRVRRALALALDRERIVGLVLKGGQPPAHRFVPAALRVDDTAAGQPGRRTGGGRASRATLPAEDEQHFEPDAARRLLADAGFPAGRGFPRLELSSWDRNTAVLETVQAMWKQELGVEVQLAVRDAKVHLAALAAGSYDLAFITAIPEVADPANLLGHYTTGAPDNYPHWREARFDALLAGAGRDPAALVEAEARLLRAAAVAPLYFNTKIWLMSPRVRGWQEDGLWTRCYQTITLNEN
jgi:oligopeptide transport system substrate-binding protein